MHPPLRPLAAIALSGVLIFATGAASHPGRSGDGAPMARTVPAWDVTGYVEDGSGADAAIRANRGSVTSIGVDTSSITADGASITPPDRGPVTVAHAIGAKATFLVSNFGASDFSPSLAAKVLESSAHRTAVARAIAAAVSAGHWDGVTIDFESLYTRDRDDLVRFVQTVRAALPVARTLAIDVPASADAHDPYIAPFDDKALAAHVNEVVLMAYDEHYQGGPAGPVAGLPWVKASLQVALAAGVPSSELQLGEAGYGYRWYEAAGGKTARSVQVGDAQARAIAAKNHVTPVWSTDQRQWHVSLPDGSVMWWSDRRAMSLDSDLATADHLRGVAVWQLILSDRLPALRPVRGSS